MDDLFNIEFVEPSTKRIQLGGNAWIDVKRELNYGEQQDLAAGFVVSMKTPTNGVVASDNPDLGIDMRKYNIARMAMWIVRWSATTPNGAPLAVTVQALTSLKAKTAERILEALDAHINEVTAEKNLQMATEDATVMKSQS